MKAPLQNVTELYFFFEILNFIDIINVKKNNFPWHTMKIHFPVAPQNGSPEVHVLVKSCGVEQKRIGKCRDSMNKMTLSESPRIQLEGEIMNNSLCIKQKCFREIEVPLLFIVSRSASCVRTSSGTKFCHR